MRLKKWIHIDFWFRDCNFRVDKYLNKKKQTEFEKLLADFITKCKPFIKRKFYLYEDLPHCFLALEIKSIGYLLKIEKLIQAIKKPEFIYKMQINTTAGDDANNGEGFLDILNAWTDFYLFKKDNRITHIVHCSMEFMMQSRQTECTFYQNMATLYQTKTIKGKKIVYGFKKLTPKLRKEMKRYINKLDLRR